MDVEQIEQRETRRYHRAMADAAKADKTAAQRRAAIERTSGIYAHLAPGESLSDQLVADRRAEVHAEELQEARQRRHRGGD